MPLAPKLSGKRKRRGDQSNPFDTLEARPYPYQPIRDVVSSIGSVGGLVPLPFVQPVFSTFTNTLDRSQVGFSVSENSSAQVIIIGHHG